MAKIRITQRGRIYGKDGEDMFDQVINVKGDVPAGWSGAYQTVRAEKTEDKEAVTNPAPADPPKKTEPSEPVKTIPGAEKK